MTSTVLLLIWCETHGHAVLFTMTMVYPAVEDSDLNSLLASRAAKRSEQPRPVNFRASSASFQSAPADASSEDEVVCNRSSSPESDQGRTSGNSPPMPAGNRRHPQRHSLSMQKGPRRRWSPESSSASLNRYAHRGACLLVQTILY